MKFFVLAAAAVALSQAADFDILIRDGRIVDGAGNPYWIGDVGIRSGKIAAMGRLGGRTAATTINARGMSVAPGFIDIHNHSDYTLLVDGNAESMIRQGVTSIILGEGGSAAPIGGKQIGADEELPSGNRLDWKDFSGYFHRLIKSAASRPMSALTSDRARSGPTFTAWRRPANCSTSYAKCKARAPEAMRQGALGVASRLADLPVPGSRPKLSSPCVSAAAEFGGIYSTHMRTEGQGVFEAVAEAIRIGREAGVPVDIIHLKLADRKLWGQMPELVSTIAQARANGQDITANVYPYRAGQNDLASIIPPWAHEGGPGAMIARLKDQALRGRGSRAKSNTEFPDRIGTTTTPQPADGRACSWCHSRTLHYKKYEGRRMNEVIQEIGGKPLDVLFQLLEQNGGSRPDHLFPPR